jgi:protein bicaudal C
MQRTKTTILFPDASDPNIPPIRKGSVTVTGMINNVYLVSMLLNFFSFVADDEAK